MTQRHLSRRLLVGGTSAALLLGAVGFLPLLGSASAATACPSWTDPAGDAVAGDPFLDNKDPSGLSASNNLDIVNASFSSTATTFTATFKSAKLSDNPSDAGDEFHMNFTVNGHDLQIYSDRNPSTSPIPPVPALPGVGAPLGNDAGLVDFSNSSSPTGAVSSSGVATATYDVAKSTVTISAKVKDLETLAGVPLVGKPVTAIAAGTADYVWGWGTVFGYDTAATTQPMTFGVDCGSTGGTPAPAGTGTPSPTASPSPSGSPSPSQSATSSTPAGTLFDQPRAKCATFTDPAGDADPTKTGEGNQKAVDVTQVNLKSPADGSVQVYVQVADLGGGFSLPAGEGGVYTTTLTIAGKAIAVTFDDTGAVSSTTVGGTATTDLVPTVKADTKKSNFVLTLPKAGLEKALKVALAPGTAVTNTTIATQVSGGTGPASGSLPADTAAGTTPEQKTYAYGDNTCFLPPPGKLQIDADPNAQYTDTTELFATLSDADDNTVEGATVTATLSGGMAVSAVTDSDGIADIVLPIGVAAGSHPITVSFAGTGDVGATSATVPFTVLAEKAVLKAVAVKGGASATLLDDDKHPIVGQPVTLTVGSKKTVVKTNAKGVVVIGKLAKGTAIKLAFTGVAGKYTATPTYTVKAL